MRSYLTRNTFARCAGKGLSQRRQHLTIATTQEESEQSCTEAATEQKVRSRSGQDNEVKEPVN